MGRPRIAVLLLALALGWWLAAPAASAQETVTLSGTLINGTPDAPFTPQEVPVTLRVLEGAVTLEPQTVLPDPDGRFALPGVPVAEGRLYFVSVEYQGAVYSETLEPGELGEPVTLTVYEATSSTEALAITSSTLFVTGADAQERVVEVLERVSVANRGNATLVADLTEPGAMGFLRFGLPPGSFNLDVRSDLVGGQVLEVDRGFAITTPVPPTSGEPQHLEFIYWVPYEGSTADLSRSLPFGADSFRLLLPTDVGSAESPALTDLGTATVEGRDYQLLEGFELARGTRLELELRGLPQPSLWSRVGGGAARWYLAAGVPFLVGAVLLGLLARGVWRRRYSWEEATDMDPAARREAMLREMVALEERLTQGRVSHRQYSIHRERLKRAMLALDLERSLEEMAPPSEIPPPAG